MSIRFEPSLIALNVECVSPEQAIEKAGKLLESANLCTTEYLDEMQKVFQQYGAYIVLDTGIAMPHARPEKGALGTGLSIMTLSKPVVFGNSDFDPVEVVVAIVTNDVNTHFELLQLVVSLIENDFVTIAKQASSKEMLLDFINPFINGKADEDKKC